MTTGQPVSSFSTAPTRLDSIAPQKGFYVTYGAMGIVLIAFLLAILRGLRGWSLSDALSEDSGNGVLKPSVSRLIALLGFAVILCIYLGTGCGVIFRLLAGGNIADLSGLGTFLVGAAALFTPYIANQIKGAVIGVVNGPQPPVPGVGAGGMNGIQATAPGPLVGAANGLSVPVPGTNG